ncbi:recombinase family protein [Nocardia amamiensis]|uniref:recombinase family protein n=1 Tax=Nocardia amamiensis TaxID=404578 RepID=UPI001E498E02|nr:recombinase family protein [Nocardia amamiensis]
MSANQISAIFDIMLIGYGRVSTADHQNPAHQIDALRRAGVDEANIHIDIPSEVKSSRPNLELVLTIACRGTPSSSPASTGWAGRCCTRSPSARPRAIAAPVCVLRQQFGRIRLVISLTPWTAGSP